MQTELPTLLNVFEADYELQHCQQTKINTSRIIHDRKLRNSVTTALTLVAVGFSAFFPYSTRARGVKLGDSEDDAY